MTSCPEAGILGYFWKKQWVEIWDWTKRVGIRIWARPVQLFAARCGRVCWVGELRADAGRTDSIVKIVSLSLSLRVENLKVKKVINVSYLNQKSRQCFAGFLCMWTFNTSVYMHYVHFTYSYLAMLHWEQWQWRGTPHCPKLEHYWSLTIWLLSVKSRALIGGVLSFCRDVFGVFCSPSWLAHQTLIEGVLPFFRYAVSVFCSPYWLGHRTFIARVLPLCRDAVSVFYSPANWAIGHSLAESYLSAEMQSVYFAPPANWAIWSYNLLIILIIIIMWIKVI